MFYAQDEEETYVEHFYTRVEHFTDDVEDVSFLHSTRAGLTQSPEAFLFSDRTSTKDEILNRGCGGLPWKRAEQI